MKRRIMMSFAVAGLLSSAAFAQTTNNRAGASTGLRTTDGLFTNRLGLLDTRMTPQAGGGAGALGSTTFQFVPGVGFVPMTMNSANSFNNGLGVNNGFGFNNGLGVDNGLGFNNGLGFDNGFNNFGFTPGFGGFNGFGPAWSGPLVDVRGAWAQGGGGVGMRGTGWNGTGIPTLGMNVRAAGPAQRPVGRVRVKLTQDPTIEQQVAGARQEIRQAARQERQTDAEQARLASNLENVMDDRPLREGTITSLGATSVQVRFRAGNQVTTQQFPMEEVYFFKAGGLMATAATDPDLVGVGSRVLIPEPPRQSVAGSRQESTFSSGTVTVKPDTARKSPTKKTIKRKTR